MSGKAMGTSWWSISSSDEEEDVPLSSVLEAGSSVMSRIWERFLVYLLLLLDATTKNCYYCCCSYCSYYYYYCYY